MPERDSKGRFPKGNGAGVGGAAKAVRPAFTPANQPAPAEKSAGWDVAKEIRERIAARRHEILEAQFARATDPAHAQGHAAATDLLNRILPPRQEISGAEGGPLEIRRVIVDPKSDD